MVAMVENPTEPNDIETSTQPAADVTPDKRTVFTAPLLEHPDPAADRLDDNEQPLQPKDL